MITNNVYNFKGNKFKKMAAYPANRASYTKFTKESVQPMIHMSGFANLLNPIVVKEFDPENPPSFPDDKIKFLGTTQEATGAETTAERQSRQRNNREILKQASELEKQHEEKVKKHLNWENHTKELTCHLVKLLNAADARIVVDPTNKLDSVPKVIEYLHKRYKNLGDATGSVELV
jgi:hypothetical protein